MRTEATQWVRSGVKSTIAAVLWRYHVRRRRSARAGAPPPFIIGYHRVVEDYAAVSRTAIPAMTVSREMFERQLDWLSHHFRFVSLDEIGDRMERHVPFTEPVAALTFDDGYRDAYEVAFPILRDRGIPACFFVVTDLISRECWQTYDRLYALLARAYEHWTTPREALIPLLERIGLPAHEHPDAATTRSAYHLVSYLLPALSQRQVIQLADALAMTVPPPADEAAALPLTWDMVQEMHAAGFTIGSHTRTHVWLGREAPQRVHDELERSKQDLEARLGAPVKHFAYPGGQFTSAVVSAVARAGYCYAYTACRHRSPVHPLLTIPRVLLWERSSVSPSGAFAPHIMGCQASGYFGPADACQRGHA